MIWRFEGMWLKLGLGQLTTSCACDGRVTVPGAVNMCVSHCCKRTEPPFLGVFSKKTLTALYNSFNGNVLSIEICLLISAL